MQSEVLISYLEKIYSELIRLKARVKVIDEKIDVTAARASLFDKKGPSLKEGESMV